MEAQKESSSAVIYGAGIQNSPEDFIYVSAVMQSVSVLSKLDQTRQI